MHEDASASNDAAITGHHRRFTTREHEIMQLAAQGLPNKRIAVTLGVSERTVATHLERLFAWLGVHTRTEAAIAWMYETTRRDSHARQQGLKP